MSQLYGKDRTSGSKLFIKMLSWGNLISKKYIWKIPIILAYEYSWPKTMDGQISQHDIQFHCNIEV